MQDEGGMKVDTEAWEAHSTPYTWLAASRGGAAPAPESSCTLEADCRVTDILNRRYAVRSKIADAAPQDRLVESLASIWQEDRARLGGEPPPPPPSPRRVPQDVCGAVAAARVDFERAISEVGLPICSASGR
jgi:hypothetical protein